MKTNGKMKIATPNVTTDHGIAGDGSTNEYSGGAGEGLTAKGNVAAKNVSIYSVAGSVASRSPAGQRAPFQSIAIWIRARPLG